MISVVVTPASTSGRTTKQRYYVVIRGIPHAAGGGVVVSSGLTREEADKVRIDIEEHLDLYRRPKRAGKRKPQTSWERIVKDS